MKKYNNPTILFPLLGIFIFICLYVIAATFYPGGSQVDKNSPGFSWINNYWCNLLNQKAINGKINPARPVALFAMLVLCFALSYFYFLFPKYTPLSKIYKRIIQFSGIISMFVSLFIFSDFHDIILNIACLIGLIAITGIFAGLWKLKWQKLFWMGLISVPLIALNNYLYYSKGMLVYLPIVQKISFLYFLLWISFIDFTIFKIFNNNTK